MLAKLRCLLLAALVVSGAVALPSTSRKHVDTSKLRTINSGQGTIDGYFYSFWHQEPTGVTMKVGAGSYDLEWDESVFNTVAGIGWKTGSDRNVTYSGTFATEGNGFLALYGWTTKPLVEYYVLEAKGEYDPGNADTAVHKGTVDVDGATYDIYVSTRNDAPSIVGTRTYPQFWSVRRGNRVGGTITTAKHFQAWEALGMKMGTHDYQILATEGITSGGKSVITLESK